MSENKIKRLSLPLANAVFIILSLVYLVSVLNHPYIGLALENKGDNWTVVYSDPHGEGARLGIREGDIILKMDDIAPGSYPSIQKWGEVEGVAALSVKSPGEAVRSIQIAEYPYIKTLSNEFPMIVIGLCFWLIGFYSVVKRPLLRQAQVLFWLNWLIGLLFILAPASSRGLFLAKEIMFIGFSLAPVLLLYFLVVLVKLEQHRFLKIMLRLLCILPVMIGITILLKWLGLVYAISEVRTMTLINVLIGTLATLFLLIRALKEPNAQPEKKQVSIMLAGLVVSLFPFVIFTAIPIIAGTEPILYSKLTTLFIVFLPLTMSYVVVNQYLPDARKILKDMLTYFITGIVTSLILYLILYTSGWIPVNDIDIFLSLFALTTGSIIVFFGLKTLGDKIINRLVSVKDYESKENWMERQEQGHFSDEILILEDLVSQLELEGALVLVEERGSFYLKKAVGRYCDNSMEQKILEDYYRSTPNTIHSGQILPRNFPAEFYLSFVSGNFKCGLFLGYRHSHITMAAKEIPLINIIGYQVCQRLKATYAIKSLAERISYLEKKLEESKREQHVVTIVKRWLFRNFEEEKKKLAREIHDGPLQNCLYLTRKVKEFRKPSVEPGDSRTLSEMQELMEELNYELRTICSKLRPSALKDLGLIPALENLIQEVMRKELVTITFKVNGFVWEERLEEDIELAIFRLLQEGIRNVVKHSGSNKAEITLAQKDQEIQVELQDFGQGFNADVISEDLLADNQFGIMGMKERVESLGGRFSIVSKSFQGNVVCATLPNRKGG